jgi:chemotaxis methyl-accepting protein methylase
MLLLLKKYNFTQNYIENKLLVRVWIAACATEEVYSIAQYY